MEVSAGVFRHSYSADSISERRNQTLTDLCCPPQRTWRQVFIWLLTFRPLRTSFMSLKPRNVFHFKSSSQQFDSSVLCKLVTGLTMETIRSVLWVNVSCRTRFRLEKKGKCCSRMRSQGVEKCRISNSCRADKIVSPPCHFCLAWQTILKSFLLK